MSDLEQIDSMIDRIIQAVQQTHPDAEVPVVSGPTDGAGSPYTASSAISGVSGGFRGTVITVEVDFIIGGRAVASLGLIPELPDTLILEDHQFKVWAYRDGGEISRPYHDELPWMGAGRIKVPGISLNLTTLDRLTEAGLRWRDGVTDEHRAPADLPDWIQEAGR